jgi:hypothetical protein
LEPDLNREAAFIWTWCEHGVENMEWLERVISQMDTCLLEYLLCLMSVSFNWVLCFWYLPESEQMGRNEKELYSTLNKMLQNILMGFWKK